MKFIIVTIALLCATTLNAKITKVSIQASGLTCSMCSKAINTALKKVAFVAQVNSNIATSSFDVVFNNTAPVNFDALKAAVENAGFAVASFIFEVDNELPNLINNSHTQIDSMQMHFTIAGKTINNKKFKIIDKGYLSAKAYKKIAATQTTECFKTGTTAPCCSQAGKNITIDQRMYHALNI
jgi:copper chaperone CopZ